MSIYYSKAPIIEAVLDLRVTLPEGVTSETFAPLKAGLADEFPIQEDFAVHTAEVNVAETPTSSVRTEQKGFRLISGDRRRVLILSTSGFTFSHLAPYNGWEVFRDEAHSLWDRYRATCQPLTIVRVGIRYINRFDLPTDRRMEEYLTLYPNVPELPEGAVEGYFMQLQIPQNDINAMLVINQARVDAQRTDVLSLILDIDLFREAVWNVAEDASVWAFIEQLRQRKNEFFEASITPKMREVIA